MDRRTFLVLGSVGAATSMAGCNDLSFSNKNEAKAARPDGGEEEPTPEDNNIVAKFKGSGSRVTDEFNVENIPGININIGYSGLNEFNAYLQFPSEDFEDVLITKTSRAFSGEFYFQPDVDTVAIKVSIPNPKGNEEWKIKVIKREIILMG